MRKGCRKTSSLNRLAEGLISSGKKSFALRAWRLGGRKSPKISSRKGFGREPQPNGAKHALSDVEGFAKFVDRDPGSPASKLYPPLLEFTGRIFKVTARTYPAR